MSHKNNSITNILSESELSTINEMVESKNSDSELELEVGFKNIDYPTYIRIVKSLVGQTDGENIGSTVSLDVIILLTDGNSFRFSFQNQDLIDKFIDKCVNSRIKLSQTDIQRYILGLRLDMPDTEVMLKNKGAATMLQIDDLNMVFKLTKETKVTAQNKPTLTGGEKLLFRLKDRHSFTLNKNIRIDVTEVQQSNNIWNLLQRNTQYEIEAEVINKSVTAKELLGEITSMLKIVQDTDIPIGKKESTDVISEYKKILNIRYGIHLEKRSTVSIEGHHIINFIPNKYAITDKADGERYHLFSIKRGTYLISNNLTVRKLGISMKDGTHTMILDGEYVETESGKMFLLFDVIYAKEIDYRFNTKFNLVNRVNVLTDIVAKSFDSLIPFADYVDKHTEMELGLIRNFYTAELKKYFKEFKKRLDLSHKKSELFITRKLYFIPYGIDMSEVFMYADLVWKLSVYEGITPYDLDGIVYTPIDAPYMIKASKEEIDSVPLEYKWKNPKQNSIDFYILFEKDEHGADIVFYDQSTKHGTGKPYKIAKLHVGVSEGSYEKPTPFKIDGIEQKAYISAADGTARDVEDRPIDNSTVVEFIFDFSQTNKTDIDATIQETDSAYKWIPIKTRYDKTEAVIKYNKMYGNPNYIAQRIWRSIINPVTESTIALLANPSAFQKEITRLKKVAETFAIVPDIASTNRNIQTQEFTGYTGNSVEGGVYYEKQTEHGNQMRAFHNWIKSNIILTYCMNKNSILDIGCGRGGDLNKFINAKIGEYVGTDIDNNGLYVIEDCAYCRYKVLKKRNPKVPPMIFINADSKGLFNVKSQEKIIPNMTNKNAELIAEYLSGKKKYNVINCQFSLHYYLSDEISWKNFCKNINNCSAPNAYLLITTFDGKAVRDKLMGKSKLTMSYTDNAGNKNTFAEITKLYSDTDTNNIGLTIGVYNSTISKTVKHIEEYLVDPDFLIESMAKNCGMELVETDSFFNLFNLYKKYFTQQSLESNMQMGQKQYELISGYYKTLDPKLKNKYTGEEIELARASFAFSSLNRYFVFKKTVNIDLDEPARIVGINGRIHLDKILTPYFASNKMVIDIDNKVPRINKLYQNMKTMTGGAKPAIFLVRHSLLTNNINGDTYKHNSIQLAKLKQGSDPSILLIYKSPEKYFYPVYQQCTGSRKYLFTDENIISNLELLVELVKKLNK